MSGDTTITLLHRRLCRLRGHLQPRHFGAGAEASDLRAGRSMSTVIDGKIVSVAEATGWSRVLGHRDGCHRKPLKTIERGLLTPSSASILTPKHDPPFEPEAAAQLQPQVAENLMRGGAKLHADQGSTSHAD